jgi:hypothetical protein
VTDPYGSGSLPEVSDEQRQAIIDQYKAEAAAKAAQAPAASQAQAPPLDATAAGDAGPQLSQMTDRGPLLPAEQAISELFEQLKAQSEQIAALQGQVVKAQQFAQAARQLAGPPAVVTYANGIAAKLASHRDANPDLPRGHFDDAIGHAEELAQHAATLGDGDLSVAGRLEGLASKVGRFVTRTHLRRTNKHLDMSAIVDELESVLEEVDKLTSDESGKAGASSGQLVRQ